MIAQKKQFNFSKQKQIGASFLGIVCLLVLVGVFLLSAIKVMPFYLDNNVVVNAMEAIENNNDMETISIGEIRTAVQQTLLTNGIREFDTGSIVLTREGSRQYIDINYEKRSPLFSNIEIVVVFENRFDKN